jgi:hypothetical protein
MPARDRASSVARRLTIGLLGAVVALVAVLGLGDVLVDWLWFDSLGFGEVFRTTWLARLAVFAVAAGVSFLVLGANALVATSPRHAPIRRSRLRNVVDIEGLPDFIDLTPERIPWRPLALALAALLSILVGLAQVGSWAVFLKWLYAAPFGRTEPLLGHDLGFYAFALPALRAVRDWAFGLFFIAAVMAGGLHVARGAIDVQTASVTGRAARHLSVLLVGVFLVLAANFALGRYDLLLDQNGVVFGATYTDVHVRLPWLDVLIGLALVGAALAAANVVRGGVRLPVAAVALVVGGAVLEALTAGLFQGYRVKPDELRLETPYIATNIELTRYGFGLDRFGAKPFPAKGSLTPAVLAANDATIQNIRWWDPRPLLDTYRQLQELRLYYDFHDVDVDRYTIDGRYREVMLAARELEQTKLPPEAQTWINKHFKYTHGIGIAMSPVDRFDDEGLPVFYVKDIPPVSSVGPRIERPEIYFGESASPYVVVGGGNTEFDYAKGQENVYTTYAGGAGIALDGPWRRALFAWYFGDAKLLVSGNVGASSKLLFRRALGDRIRRVAPFLWLDRDPYLVVAGGRLVWLQDAYTVSDAVPYSQPTGADGINYIRNSVKIAVDAYDGSIVFYVADAAEPVVSTYARIFPSLFRPLDAMPAELRQHVRYPEDLFVLQARTYATYHMTDPEVFYNKEDLWDVPQESAGDRAIPMEPYYTIMRLPGEPHEEFVAMLPMAPSGRDNMIAWLAARCDGPQYGTVIEYAFPKDQLVFGPAQVEARIDQDTTISQQLSLWNQLGSRVIRGNLLVIPIDDAILYVEPLYLRAERRELPELKRLIASTGDRVVMGTSVDGVMKALFAGEEKAPATVTEAPPPSAEAPGQPPAEAQQHYARALEALRQGDWRAFGAEMDALGKALQRP